MTFRKLELPAWATADDPASIVTRSIAESWGHRTSNSLVMMVREKRLLFADAAKDVIAALNKAGYVIKRGDRGAAE